MKNKMQKTRSKKSTHPCACKPLKQKLPEVTPRQGVGHKIGFKAAALRKQNEYYLERLVYRAMAAPDLA